MLKNARRDGPTTLLTKILPKFKDGAPTPPKKKKHKKKRDKNQQPSKLQDCVILCIFILYTVRWMGGASLFNQILFIDEFVREKKKKEKELFTYCDCRFEYGLGCFWKYK